MTEVRIFSRAYILRLVKLFKITAGEILLSTLSTEHPLATFPVPLISIPTFSRTNAQYTSSPKKTGHKQTIISDVFRRP